MITILEPPTDGVKPCVKSADLSLFAGGPLKKLLFRTRHSEDNMAVRRQLVGIALALLAWLPLLGLSGWEGHVFGGNVAIPFLHDVEVHVRLLLALPLLIVAELVTEARLRPVPQQFIERELIPEKAMTRFKSAIESAMRLRDSAFAEVLIIAFVYGAGILIWRRYVVADTATWYATPFPDGHRLSLAGTWYAWVSLPIFQFILCRWYFRLFIWARFLWRVSRIRLKLVPTHPDGLAGLSFLSNTLRVLSIFALAHGTLLAGYLATHVVILGTSLIEFKAEIAAVVILVLCVTTAPLLVFAPQLSEARRNGLRDYGRLATRYVGEFDAKWVDSTAGDPGSLLGSADIQSLADMGNSYAIVRAMRVIPITGDAIYRLTAATLAPMIPLLLTMMPLEQILRKLASIIL
ncbi:hypothetical protein E0H35_20130 [Rhizobium leguminosarum bv. viciae]|uniref:hypothetical protein n=1 Tax=Rhizobium leguminosarum TaxID=384 RepID=UPI0010398F18|nr:hypothetical protein [Rhizobium leguminosarum]MBY5344867.1 hypothetical protein [Rhizobium leguminosarum]NKK52424.1 hypothetical protein [Rhizobium leguminosarum bv. viciae]TBY96813.1 hypothetical protein E0H35_20130 [Rhizobium leguminosarum bv. viciae]